MFGCASCTSDELLSSTKLLNGTKDILQLSDELWIPPEDVEGLATSKDLSPLSLIFGCSWVFDSSGSSFLSLSSCIFVFSSSNWSVAAMFPSNFFATSLYDLCLP